MYDGDGTKTYTTLKYHLHKFIECEQLSDKELRVINNVINIINSKEVYDKTRPIDK